MDLVLHAKISIAGPLQCLDFFMIYCRVTLALANYFEGVTLAVDVADLIWTVGAFGAV